MNYFAITVPRGHCGSGKSIDIIFAIKAENISIACKKAKKMPAIKHSHGIINAKTITEEEYNNIRSTSAYNVVESTQKRTLIDYETE